MGSLFQDDDFVFDGSDLLVGSFFEQVDFVGDLGNFVLRLRSHSRHFLLDFRL